MAHAFLSDAWFDEVDKLRAEHGDPDVPENARDMKINFVVTGVDGDRTVDGHLQGGVFDRGHVDGATTTVTLPADTAKAILVNGDQQAGMQAFMSGAIKVEGDMTKIMQMQAQQPTPSMQAFQERLQQVTA